MTFENHKTATGEYFTIIKSSETAIIWAISIGNRVTRFEVWPVYRDCNGWQYNEDKIREFNNLHGAEGHFKNLHKHIKNNN